MRAWRLRVARVLVTLVAAVRAKVGGTIAAATQVLARLLLSALARGLGALARSLLLAQLQSTLRLVAHARAGAQLVDTRGALGGLCALARHHVTLAAGVAYSTVRTLTIVATIRVVVARLVRQVQLVSRLIVSI